MVNQVLRDCELFSALNDKELEKVSNLASEKEFDAGTTIFHEGDRAEELFVLKEGRIALQMALQSGQANRSISVDIVTKNDAFGWPAIVEPYTYSLTAVCLQKSKVLAISGSKLRWLLEENSNIDHEVLKGLVKVLISRLEETRRVLISERLLSLPERG